MIVDRLKFRVIGLLFILTVVTPSWGQSSKHNHASAVDDHKKHTQHGNHAVHTGSTDEHVAHRAAMAKSADFKMSMEHYIVPDIELINTAGTPVSLRTLLTGDYPVAVNFIFTTCTTICPVMTATFAQMRNELGSEADQIRMVSITIDPEHDTPDVLNKYAKLFDAPQEWSFLTGNPADVERVLRIFDAWTGSKTSHLPLTLMHRKGADGHWMRLEGLSSGVALAEQARTVIK